MDERDPLFIAPSLFDDKTFCCNRYSILCEKDNKSKNFINKLHHFANGKYHISLLWITNKIKNLFPLIH